MSDDEICRKAIEMKDNGGSWQEIIDALNLSWHRTTLMRKVEKYERIHLKTEDTDKAETLSEEKQQNGDWLAGL
jgi:orotate phosphoribosyltransferase-like protein